MKYLIALLLFFTVSAGYAQWNIDTDVNTLVVDSEGGEMKAIGTSDGKTYVVFWKVVPPPTNYELRMQILDVDGSQLLGADGMLVSDAIPMSTYTVISNITIDTDNNLYIGATGTGGGDPAYAFKLDSSGNHLWGANGINVGSGNVVTIRPLPTGEAIVSWWPGGQSLMQKYDASGNAVWGSTQAIVSGGSDTTPGNLFEMSDGGFVMVFHVLIGGINSFLYAQRYNSDGVAQWTNPTQLANSATTFISSYSGTQDGDVVYMGYKASPGSRFDSYLQRVNPDGSLPWGVNGMDFDTNQTDYEMDTRIAFNPSSQYIWSICTYTNTSQGEKGEYVQKFDKTSGARQFTDNAKQIYPIGSENIHAGDLQLKNDTPLFLLKSGIDNGASPTTLGVVYLDENGDFVWLEESRPVATFSANKSRIHYTNPFNNQSVAAFIEDKGNGPKIYAQNFIDEVLSLEDFSMNAKIFFNNPVRNELKIESDTAIESVSIVTMLGQKLFSENYNNQKELIIETSTWNTGTYFITVYTEKGEVKTAKILKQ